MSLQPRIDDYFNAFPQHTTHQTQVMFGEDNSQSDVVDIIVLPDSNTENEQQQIRPISGKVNTNATRTYVPLHTQHVCFICCYINDIILYKCVLLLSYAIIIVCNSIVHIIYVAIYLCLDI